MKSLIVTFYLGQNLKFAVRLPRAILRDWDSSSLPVEPIESDKCESWKIFSPDLTWPDQQDNTCEECEFWLWATAEMREVVVVVVAGIVVGKSDPVQYSADW